MLFQNVHTLWNINNVKHKKIELEPDWLFTIVSIIISSIYSEHDNRIITSKLRHDHI